ncbi:carbohydrate ABC transporter permease [Streptomyces sp. NP160]|uniref:carbohydrate ABC transporter permease n=1 Tax=Streptomyces sp. NP160 TaxID=2586637 RepID=UPI001C564DFC|nr:sugar ABC transporter permease [Streptomyces sp. NP160]
MTTAVQQRAPRARRPQRVSEPLSRRSERRMAALLLVPAVAVVALALGYPLVRQVVMSFQQFGLAQQFGQPPEFVGLSNYTSVLSDPSFWAVLGRSVGFCFVVALITMVVGTAGALLLTACSRPVAVCVQVVMLLAWAMPVLSSLQVFQWMFDSRSGVVDWALAGVGFDGMAGFNWFSTPGAFFSVAGLLVTWMSVPLVVFMVYAAVTQIDTSVLEAAALDGANAVQAFRHVIAPSIAPVLALVTLLEIIWDLRVFTQFHVLQANGGITEQTNVLGTYVYQVGLAGGNYGAASAAALLLLLLTLGISARYIALLLKEPA